MVALDHVISFYGVSQEVESVVRAGPGPVANGGSGLDAFLQAMNKLQVAQEYFEKNNPQSVELENVVSVICLFLLCFVLLSFSKAPETFVNNLCCLVLFIWCHLSRMTSH